MAAFRARGTRWAPKTCSMRTARPERALRADGALLPTKYRQHRVSPTGGDRAGAERRCWLGRQLAPAEKAADGRRIDERIGRSQRDVADPIGLVADRRNEAGKTAFAIERRAAAG